MIQDAVFENIVTIEVKDPRTICDRIADLTCWWDGFKLGLKVGEGTTHIVADNGIQAIKDLRDILERAQGNQRP